jgi:predicted nucleotidyltransferase
MSTEAKSLGNLLFGQTRGRVLALLYGAPDASFFVRQIAREVDTSAGSVQRELETLSHFGLLERSVVGRQIFYKANRSHPVFPEIQSLTAKTTGIFNLLSTALLPVAKRISFAFVYGSMARGDADFLSDVDLIVIGDISMDDVLENLAATEKSLGRPINPTIYSRKEFRSKLQHGNHFLKSVIQGPKVFIAGDEDEFGKVA